MREKLPAVLPSATPALTSPVMQVVEEPGPNFIFTAVFAIGGTVQSAAHSYY